jgi:hypothetical protein
MPLRSLRALLVGALTCFAATACDDDPTDPTGPTAELRLLHATSNLGAVDLLIGGQTVISGITFGNASSITEVPAGTQRLVVRSGATVLGEIDANLSTSHVNAVTVASGVPQFSETVVPDTGAAASNRANIRLVNVVGTNTSDPTLLDVLINFPGVSPDSTATLGMDSKIASYGTLMYFDAGQFRFRFVPDGGSTILAEATFAVANGEKKAVVLQRDPNGTYRVEVVTEQ